MNRFRNFIGRTAIVRRAGGARRRGALLGGILIGVALIGGFWLTSNVIGHSFGLTGNTNPATLPTPPGADQNAPDADQRDASQSPDANDPREAAPQAPATEGRGPSDRPAPERPDRDGPPAGPRHDHTHDAPPAPQPLSAAPGAWWGALAAPFAWIPSALQWINTAATVMFAVLCIGTGATLLLPRGTTEAPRE